MKSESTIKMEYNDVIVQANKLDKCVSELQEVTRQLDQVINDLRAGWEGESANLFCSKCDELYVKIKRSSNDVDKTSDVIRRTARIYRDMELAAIKILQD